MKKFRGLCAVLFLPVVLAGCSNPDEVKLGDWNACLLGGAAAGIAAGAVTGGNVIGALVGGATGAMFGAVLCADSDMIIDSDGDGVPDEFDKCPGTPEGMGVDGDGCPLDSDGDGVPDYKDKCYRTYGKGPDGCPIDSDGDGVPDGQDKCANTPAGSRVDEFGCSLIGEKMAIVTNINFAFDKSAIGGDDASKLDGVAATLAAHDCMRVRIDGYTDSTGPDDYNRALSFRRAESVRKYLMSKGIAESRLSIAGFGEANPIASNSSSAGRAENRRAEFTVIGN